jgi:hypothetical protein
VKELRAEAIVGTRILDERDLSDSVFETCRKVLELVLSDPDVGADLAERLEPALDDLIAVEIAPLDKSFGAFRMNAGTLTLNENDAAHLISYVIDDMKEQVSAGTSNIGPSEVRETLEDTLSLFALHELRHRTQGVADYATVQLLKKITGREELAKFDIQADRDAAVALAAARSGGMASEEFLSTYQRALFYSVRYFFKIYPANAERPDKVCRVAALLFMLARLELYQAMGCLVVGSPTTALCVRIGPDNRSIAVFEGDPRNKLLCVANDCCEVGPMIADIEQGRLEDALGRAFTVAVAIGLN